MKKLNVTIWNEFYHEKNDETVRAIYPEGVHGAIRKGLADHSDFDIRLASLDEPEQGLPDSLLNQTDVLLWWGHLKHGEVDDGLVNRICDRVLRHGMGFIALHSAHASKPFGRLVGTTGSLCWGDNQTEIVWNLLPQHPIAAGISDCFVLPEEELYCEPFRIPVPDELVFTSWFRNGNIFRSGCCFYRGLGKIFYFQPGHETCRSYYDPNVLRVISNAIYWAAPLDTAEEKIDTGCPHIGSTLKKLGLE